MVTTIQLSETIKEELKSLKEKRNESYEDVIVRLIKKSNLKMKRNELLKEGYLQMNEDKELINDWNQIDRGWD